MSSSSRAEVDADAQRGLRTCRRCCVERAFRFSRWLRGANYKRLFVDESGRTWNGRLCPSCVYKASVHYYRNVTRHEIMRWSKDLSPEDWRECKRRYLAGDHKQLLAKEYGMLPASIRQRIRREQKERTK